MKITYNGVVIAAEPPDGGTDAVTGFKPKAKTNVFDPKFLRAAYDTPIPRGNRVITLTGTITPSPSPTLEAAMLALEMLYGSLPESGDLVKTINGNTVTYPAAVLETFVALEDRNGVSIGYQLTFIAGAPSVATPGGVIGGPDGDSLGTETGDQIGTET